MQQQPILNTHVDQFAPGLEARVETPASWHMGRKRKMRVVGGVSHTPVQQVVTAAVHVVGTKGQQQEN